MADEMEFPKGLMVKKPRDGAPDFVIASISIKREELIEWLSSKDGERETPLSDLAVLCANCHRAIHRLGPEMPSVEELAAIIRSRK